MPTLFIIGDVHGCYYTLKTMLSQHWEKDDHLIFLGDLIDRGNHSYKVVELVFNLKIKNPDIDVLLGNHELEFMKYLKRGENPNWMRQVGEKTIADFKENNANFKAIGNFLNSFRHKWENDELLITHAGVSQTINPYQIESRDGILWNRKPLINVGKIQIKGHTPVVKRPIEFDEQSQSWNIDSGACFGYHLTGLKITTEGEFVELIQIKTAPKDISPPQK